MPSSSDANLSNITVLYECTINPIILKTFCLNQQWNYIFKKEKKVFMTDVAVFFFLFLHFFAVWWILLLLRESLIQRPSLCWWLSVVQTLCPVCGCCCGQKALQPAIHHQILIRFHHRTTADIWFIPLGAILEFRTVNKGSLGNVNVVLFWGTSVEWEKLGKIM